MIDKTSGSRYPIAVWAATPACVCQRVGNSPVKWGGPPGPRGSPWTRSPLGFNFLTRVAGQGAGRGPGGPPHCQIHASGHWSMCGCPTRHGATMGDGMRNYFLATIVCLSALVAQEPYKQPPKAVLDVLHAPALPGESLSPSGDVMILRRSLSYPPIADVAQPM